MSLSYNETLVLEKIKNKIHSIFESNFEKNKPIIIISTDFNQDFFDEIVHYSNIITFLYNTSVFNTIGHSLSLDKNEIDEYSVIFNLNTKMSLNKDIKFTLNKPISKFNKKRQIKKLLKTEIKNVLNIKNETNCIYINYFTIERYYSRSGIDINEYLKKNKKINVYQIKQPFNPLMSLRRLYNLT